MSDSDAEEAESAGKDQDWEDWEEDCQAPTRSFSLSSRFYFVFPFILLSIDLVLMIRFRDILYNDKQHESPEVCIKHCTSEYVPTSVNTYYLL